jgi:general nucleoside transport system ATP-binding protein
VSHGVGDGEHVSSALAREPASTPCALRLTGITKRFGNLVANRDISLTVQPGEIHALLGENGAGKTTLMNVVFGLLEPDSGTVEVAGKQVEIRNPRDARAHGIGMVHQHFKLVPDMTVAENLALSTGLSGLGTLRLSDVRTRASAIAGRFGLGVDPDALIENLSVGQHQRVEILKLLYGGANLLILDEPTAALTPGEWASLSEVLRALVGEGKAVVFISHKLEEVIGIASRCTVLRDGQVVGTREIAATTKEELALMMVGREVALRVVRDRCDPGPAVLEVAGLTVDRDGRDVVCDVSFDVREQEVLGIAGVDGNGQSELVEALIGVRDRTAGTVTLDGIPTDAMADHPDVGVVPEDRHLRAVAAELSVADNLMLKDFHRAPFARRGLRDHRAVRKHCEELITRFDIRTPGLDLPLRQLSGGNQQKVVLARELAREPRLLIAAQPTRGLDVGAMEFVYTQLARFKRRGGATLLISTELEEVLSLSDRIAVMVGGRLVGVLDADQADLNVIGMLMGGEGARPPEAATA